jgi:phage terminase large subunit-like protein
VKLVRGPWNDAYIAELENFPDGKHDDQVDGSSGAFTMFTKQKKTLNFIG